MRQRLPKWATAGMAAMCVALLVNGCEARVWGTPPAADDTPPATVVTPPATLPVLPAAPPDQPPRHSTGSKRGFVRLPPMRPRPGPPSRRW